MRIYPDSDMMMEVNDNLEWVAEQKKNGWRCLIWKENGKMSMWNRHGQKSAVMTSASNDLLMYFAMTLPDNTVIDGEFLDRRMVSKEFKGIYYAFDVLYWKGDEIMTLPLHFRRGILENVVKPYEKVWIPQWRQTDKLGYYFESIKSPENEGIVIKKLTSVYGGNISSCKDVPHWLKVKKEGA
jgi:ATP-dependent DNA ligase